MPTTVPAMLNGAVYTATRSATDRAIERIARHPAMRALPFAVGAALFWTTHSRIRRERRLRNIERAVERLAGG